MTAVFYITGHGLGHASRTLEIINQLSGDVRVIVRTSAPSWFIESSATRPLELQPAEVDVGMIQDDSLSLDLDATARQIAAFYADFPRAGGIPAPGSRVEREADTLRRLDATIVVGDIPPLAFAAARAAGVPSIAVGNFTWDWIYDGYPALERGAAGTIDTIRAAYGTATLALRMPFYGGFASMPAVRDIPLVARRATQSKAESRAALGIAGDEPVVLASFGGHGLRLSYAEIARTNQLTIFVTDHESKDPAGSERLHVLSRARLNEIDLRYADLVAAADVVLTKPGYGIISECIANGASLLYARRAPFLEQDVFLREMPHVLRVREISRDDLDAGRWTAPVHALLAQPRPPETMAANGAEEAARIILGIAGKLQ